MWHWAIAITSARMHSVILLSNSLIKLLVTGLVAAHSNAFTLHIKYHFVRMILHHSNTINVTVTKCSSISEAAMFVRCWA
jgi:sterol desaturase/sphingolipid hydroxylase (fatty acid hydroxylase superfamily)